MCFNFLRPLFHQELRTSFTISRNTQVINSTSLAAQHFREIWDHELISLQEQVYVIFVDEDNVFIRDILLHTGGQGKCHIDIPLLFKYVFQFEASGFFLSHNHPKGSLKPSPKDIETTYKIKSLCTDLNIALLDNIVLTKKSYFSFAESRLI